MKRIDVRGVPVLKMATGTKAQALKVLEEAAELVEAVKYFWRSRYNYRVCDDIDRSIIANAEVAAIAEAADVIIAEAADIITATVGLLVAMGCDAGEICDAMAECAERQELRGDAE